jgi:hypothetical protein
MVFRSYTLIVQSDEADLMRDVCFDIDKAQTKLKAIRRQLQRDREHASHARRTASLSRKQTECGNRTKRQAIRLATGRLFHARRFTLAGLCWRNLKR